MRMSTNEDDPESDPTVMIGMPRGTAWLKELDNLVEKEAAKVGLAAGIYSTISSYMPVSTPIYVAMWERVMWELHHIIVVWK